MYKDRKKAYMTVEASLVFPMILGGIIFTIYMGFYLYNITVINQVSYIAALRGSRQVQLSDTELKKYVEKQLEQLIDDKLFFVTGVSKEIDISTNKIIVKTGAKTKIPFTGLPLLNRKWEDLECFSETVRVNPVKNIRNVRKLYED